jgi:hypothetical protein
MRANAWCDEGGSAFRLPSSANANRYNTYAHTAEIRPAGNPQVCIQHVDLAASGWQATFLPSVALRASNYPPLINAAAKTAREHDPAITIPPSLMSVVPALALCLQARHT